MKSTNKIYFVFLFFLFVSEVVSGQVSVDISDVDILIKKPIFYLKMENYRSDKKEFYKSQYFEDFINSNPYCPILFEVKNQSKTDKYLYRLRIDSYCDEYHDMIPSSPKDKGVLKPGASVFYLSTMLAPNCTKNISLLLAATLTEEELKKYDKPRSGISYGFEPAGNPYKDTIINGTKSYVELPLDSQKIPNYVNDTRGYFKFIGSLKNSHLFAIDTLVNTQDTIKLKQKYLLHKVINNFYVLHDTAHQNDLLAEFYVGVRKTPIVPIKDIEVQTKNFYYKEQKTNSYARSQDSINHTIRKRKIIAHITITNHSMQYLYVKKNINKIPTLNYTLSYFGMEAEQKNQTLKALAPNASLIVTIWADYETVRINKSIVLNTSQLFLNCPKADYKINFTHGYFID